MKKKKTNNLPMNNPMNNMIQGGMPGLPDIFSDAFPLNLPSIPYDSGFFKRKLHKGKIKDLIEIKQLEAAGAEADAKKFSSNLQKIGEALTFGPKIKDAFEEFEHKSIMRELEEREKQADIYVKEAQARQMGFEAQLSELEYNNRLKQNKKMEADND